MFASGIRLLKGLEENNWWKKFLDVMANIYKLFYMCQRVELKSYIKFMDLASGKEIELLIKLL
jgi:hypothetical protein